MSRVILIPLTLLCAIGAGSALAEDPPQVVRHEIMECAGDAAKAVGKMLKEESPFDAETAMASFNTWEEVAGEFGSLFPEGTESGHDTRAKATIWSDRAGFEAALATFSDAVDAAIAANPQDLEALKGAAGPVFKACKGCHEDYRVEED